MEIKGHECRSYCEICGRDSGQEQIFATERERVLREELERVTAYYEGAIQGVKSDNYQDVIDQARAALAQVKDKRPISLDTPRFDLAMYNAAIDKINLLEAEREELMKYYEDMNSENMNEIEGLKSKLKNEQDSVNEFSIYTQKLELRFKGLEATMRDNNDTVGVMHDERPIKSIHGVFGDVIRSWKVGASCDKIEVYGEPAEHCYVAWFLVYKNGDIVSRENARSVASVCY